MQVRLHTVRPALSHHVRSAAVRVHNHGSEDAEEANPSAQPELYLLVACLATCLPRLAELSLDLGELWYHIGYREVETYPSILAPLLAGLPHLAVLKVAYPGCADITIFQARPDLP